MKKVSIVTPCYNGEKFIEVFLQSILNQSYGNIELILIDDGSIDKTKEIILSYKNKYLNKGYYIKYIYQSNKGQAAAINNGLQYVTGEYLIWPDSDDFFHIDSIKEKVYFLENNSHYGMVRTRALMYREEDLKISIGELGEEKEPIENIFEGLINETIGCSNGKYMIRMKALKDVNPKLKIYESRAGQNWQILLPVAYKYKCGYIDKKLFFYVIRKNSHSHMGENTGYEDSLNKLNNHEDILLNVIKYLKERFKENFDYQYYYNIIKLKYVRRKMNIAFQYEKKEEFNTYYRKIEKKNNLDRKMKLMLMNKKIYEYLKLIKNYMRN